MRVINPVMITDAVVSSSTAAEPGVGEATWASGTTYAADAKAILGSPGSVVTITIASPGVVTWTGHGLPNGTPVKFTTSGTLPTGITSGVIYYVIERATDTFQLSATLDGAPVVTSGSQSGTHTATAQIHLVFRSVQGSNTGHPPAIDDGTWWIVDGPTNRWAMFDLYRNTQTWLASPLTVGIIPGVRVNSIALLGLVADSVTVLMTSGGPAVFNQTYNLITREVLDWYDYFFGEFDTTPSLIVFDLPPYSDGVITVTITNSSGNAACGSLVVGNFIDLGTTLHDSESDARNFSKVDRDEFGNSELIPRRSVPIANLKVVFDRAATKKLLDARTALNAVPTVWTGLDEDDHGYFEAVLILGFYTQFLLSMTMPDQGELTLKIEEV